MTHRDVKLANGCWLDEARTHLVLTDFGYASKIDLHSTYCGSAHFAAPEVHRTDVEARAERPNKDGDEAAPPTYSSAAADVWSLGVVLYAMLATSLPFGGGDETTDERKALRDKVCAGAWDGPLLRSRNVKELCRQMMCVDVTKRATLAQVRNDEWVNSQP